MKSSGDVLRFIFLYSKFHRHSAFCLSGACSSFFWHEERKWAPSFISYRWYECLGFQYTPLHSFAVLSTHTTFHTVLFILLSAGRYTYIHSREDIKKTPRLLIRKRTMSTERPPPVGEFCRQLLWIEWCRMVCAAENPRPLYQTSRSEPLIFFQVPPHLSSWGWVDPVSDPLLFRKSGSAGNRTRDLSVCSLKLWLLYHRGGPRANIFSINSLIAQPAQLSECQTYSGNLAFTSPPEDRHSIQRISVGKFTSRSK
jgi:hypothetical protein